MTKSLKTYLPYGLLAVVVMLPLLWPGYILTLDAVFVPHLPPPTTVSSDWLWQWLLHLLNIAVPSQIIEKLLFAGIILISAIGMHQLVAWLRERLRNDDHTLDWRGAPYAAGTLFATNPFTYDRFMAGQYGVLLGYALLPLAVRWLLEFAREPGRHQMLRLGGLAVVVGVVSLPTLGDLALVGACVMVAAMWQHRHRPTMLRLYAWRGLAAVGLFVALSSYWLLPLAAGKGTTAESIQQFTAAHTAAFATVGDAFPGRLTSVLRLQGFWAEAHGLYALPQDYLPGWGTVRLLVWALVIFGLVILWRQSRRLAATFGALGLISALLAAGLFAPQLTAVGYREPQKFVGLLALVFAVCMAFAVARLLALARNRSVELRAALISGLAIVVLLFTPTMYWGFAGQLRPRQYPAGWFAANAYLNRQPGAFYTVIVPWHQYMSFDFAGRIIANPAPRFFTRKVIASNNPELGRIMPPPGARATRLGQLLRSNYQPPDLAARLARENVRYILLAKDYDYRKYDMSRTANLRLALDTPTMSVYENMVWKGRE